MINHFVNGFGMSGFGRGSEMIRSHARFDFGSR